MSEPKVLWDAEFSPKIKGYYLWSSVLIFTLTVVLIPVAIVYLIAGSFLINLYIRNLRCTLTERTLELKKGVLNRRESTIPLDKITDLQMFQGPIMRAFGLHGFKVETAGQSMGPAGGCCSISWGSSTPRGSARRCSSSVIGFMIATAPCRCPRLIVRPRPCPGRGITNCSSRSRRSAIRSNASSGR